MEEIIMDGDKVVDIINIDENINNKALKSFNHNFNNDLNKLKYALIQCKDFINLIKSTIPEKEVVADLEKDIVEKLKNGKLEFMKNKKTGAMYANIVDAKNKRIVEPVNLKEINVTPDLEDAMNKVELDLKLKEITNKLENIELLTDEVRNGLELDRLATAISTKQKLLCAMNIDNESLRTQALLSISQSAEDSKSILMLNQNKYLKYISDIPESNFGKFIKGMKSKQGLDKDIEDNILAIKQGLTAIYDVTVAQVVAYKELGEMKSAKLCLDSYAKYLNNTLLADDSKVLDRIYLNDTDNDEEFYESILVNVTDQIEDFTKEVNFLTNKESEE